jgi:hypothetical protein
MIMNGSYDSGSVIEEALFYLKVLTGILLEINYIIRIRAYSEMLIEHLTIITVQQNCTANSMEQNL